MGVLVFFPPRLIELDDTIASSNEQIDDARDRYLAGGIAILVAEDAAKDAQKILNFAGQFPELLKGAT